VRENTEVARDKRREDEEGEMKEGTRTRAQGEEELTSLQGMRWTPGVRRVGVEAAEAEFGGTEGVMSGGKVERRRMTSKWRILGR
jgi:hypothetical protein